MEGGGGDATCFCEVFLGRLRASAAAPPTADAAPADAVRGAAAGAPGVATASLKVCSAPDQMVPRAGAARRAAVGGAALGGAAGAGAAGAAGVLSRGAAEGRAGGGCWGNHSAIRSGATTGARPAALAARCRRQRRCKRAAALSRCALCSRPRIRAALEV